MKLLIIKSECRLSGGGIKKYEDEFNRMIREDGYLIYRMVSKPKW